MDDADDVFVGYVDATHVRGEPECSEAIHSEAARREDDMLVKSREILCK